MNNLAGRLFGRTGKLSLRFILVVPFVIQILLAVGLTGWLSFRNGQQAVNNLALRLQREISDRICERTSTYLDTPRVINQINIDEFNRGSLNLNDQVSLIQHFTRIQNIFHVVNHISFGNENGDYVAVRRKPRNGQEFEILMANQSTGGNLQSYSQYRQDDQLQPLTRKFNYDPRDRPWYKDGIISKTPHWSKIYQYYQVSPLGIAHTYPAYNQAGVLQGVLAVDFDLAQISEFLRSLQIGISGQAFVIERDGKMVATSVAEELFRIDGSQTHRINAIESKNALTAAIASYLAQHFGNLSQLANQQQMFLALNGEKYFLQVTSFKEQEGIDWRLVVVIPESDFMAQINANTRNTILLCCTALTVAILFGLFVSYGISRPILQLGKTSKEIATLSLDPHSESYPPIAERSFISELDVLAQFFNQMARQLKESFTDLKSANEELEKRVAESTAELRQANQELQLLASLDSLTQIANRRRFDEYLEQSWQQLLQEEQPLALILCDVDCFKLFNDTYGHQAGDDCLIEIAQGIRRAMQSSTALVARYGGEEFAIILPNTNDNHAFQVATAIRDAITELRIPHIVSSVQEYITLSIGIADIVPNAQLSPQVLIARADEALYAAKAQGRDRIVYYRSTGFD